MARDGKKKKKKATAKSRLNLKVTSRDGEDAAYQFQDRQKAFNHREVEARIAAIRAIQMTEVPATLARLRALRSSLSEEQLQTPCLKFFQENLPNLLVVRNKESKIFELRRIDENCGGNEVNSFGNAVGDLHFFEESVKHNLLNAANLPISDFRSSVTVLDGVSDAQMPRMSGVGDMFQTPGSEKAAVNSRPCSTLFIANLGPTCTEAELEQVLSKFSGFRTLKMKGRSGMPVAFADFEDVESSAAALESLRGTTIGTSDRGEIHIEYARSKMRKA